MRKFIIMLLAVTPLFAQSLKVDLPSPNGKDFYSIQNTNYSLGFAENYGIPVWCMYKLTPQMLIGTAPSSSDWQIDSRVKGYKITPKDLTGQNLEAVQLYPKDHAQNDSTAKMSTFYTSNVVFMSKQLKDTIWKNITKKSEELAAQYGEVYVYTGPVFDRDPLKVKYTNNNKIAVPSYFYKIILYKNDGAYEKKCYRIQNRIPGDYERNCDPDEFLFNLYQLEADTGIDFFDREIDASFRQEKMKYLEKQVK
ncbi:DNA/RNA non-specific endonuclease [Treponema sp.]|uniref:DNA/RNA non-specific endonuclease n=1 Tax=Treponema sp. TaxID=166 RepID=UPI00388E5DA4